MRTIRCLVAALCTFGISAIAFAQPRMSKDAVIAIVKREIDSRFPWSVAKHYAYEAFLGSNGVWGVYVPHPDQPGLRGGGQPTAEVRDRDGKVLKVYLAR
jgi:hypothetical protein